MRTAEDDPEIGNAKIGVVDDTSTPHAAHRATTSLSQGFEPCFTKNLSLSGPDDISRTLHVSDNLKNRRMALCTPSTADATTLRLRYQTELQRFHSDDIEGLLCRRSDVALRSALPAELHIKNQRPCRATGRILSRQTHHHADGARIEFRPHSPPWLRFRLAPSVTATQLRQQKIE